MKKIRNKLSKILTSCIAFLSLIPTHIVKAIDMEVQALYGPPPDPKPNVTKMDFSIVKKVLIPVVFLAGAIVYFKKSKSSTKKKVITLIIGAIIVAIALYGVNYIFNK